jgi:hypothetical protein
MNRPSRQAALLIATALVAASAAAGGDIYRCVDGGGKVTLTDHPCAGNGGLLRAGRADDHAGGTGDVFAADSDEGVTERQVPEAVRDNDAVRTAPVTARMDKWSSGQTAVHPVDTDADTLRTAREAMHAFDSAAALMRQKRLAGVN